MKEFASFTNRKVRYADRIGNAYIGCRTAQAQLKISRLKLFEKLQIIGAPGILDNDNSVFAHGLLSLRDQRWKDVCTTVTPASTSGKIKQVTNLENTVTYKLISCLTFRSSLDVFADAANFQQLPGNNKTKLG